MMFSSVKVLPMFVLVHMTLIHVACTSNKQARFIANTASKIKVTSCFAIQPQFNDVKLCNTMA